VFLIITRENKFSGKETGSGFYYTYKMTTGKHKTERTPRVPSKEFVRRGGKVFVTVHLNLRSKHESTMSRSEAGF